MSRTVRAELHYGYYLGDHDDGWQFAEVDDVYGNYPAMPWWDEDGDELGEQAIPILLAAAGFVESDRHDDDYYDRYRVAKANLGVDFAITGYEGGTTLLVARSSEHSASCSDPTEIDPSALAAVAETADEALANALRVLGITPKQDKPAWLLTCYNG